MNERKEKSTFSCLSCKFFRFKVKSETKAQAKCLRLKSLIKGEAWKTACFARERVENDSILWKNFNQIQLYGNLLKDTNDSE